MAPSHTDQIARAEVARRNSVEFKVQSLALLDATRNRLATSGKTLATIADEIEQTLDALGPLLAHWQALVEDRSADTAAIVRETHQNVRDSVRQATNETLQSCARLSGGDCAVALARAVVRSGLARTGPQTSNYITIMEPGSERSNPMMTLAEAVQTADSRLMHSIDNHLARHKAEIEALPRA